jgi:hypothetical protein
MLHYQPVIYFDRVKQEAYYRSFGTITNKENLKQNLVEHYLNQKKYNFLPQWF